MTSSPVLLVIVGSVRSGRIGEVVARWFEAVAREQSEFDVRLLDLASIDIPPDLSENDATERYHAQIADADAFVVVTPEYNHGYPASLKLALDSAKYEWRGKAVGFVSYGGLAGGVRAVEQLRQVAAELHMVTVRDAVMFARVRKSFDDRGHTGDGPAHDGAARMLAQLRWWVDATASAPAYPG